MSDNNPFNIPPTQPPTQPPTPPPSQSPLASGDWGPTTPYNPIGPRQSGPGRGKIVGVALAAAALTGGAIFGISRFADSDEPRLSEADAPALTAPAFSLGGETVAGSSGGGSSGDNSTASPMPSIPDVFGSISECIDIEELMGSMGSLDMGSLDMGSIPMGSIPNLDFTSVGDTVTITNADGVTVYTLGEGDASIAISKSGGELTVAASGDVTESTSFDFSEFETQMQDMMGELEGMDLENLNIDEMLENMDLESMDPQNMDLENMDMGDMPAVSMPPGFDPAEIQACIENLNLDADG